MQAHATGTGHPVGARVMAAQSGELMPCHATVRRPEQRRVLDAGVPGVRIVEGRFKMPDAGKLPGVLGTVIPLVRRERLSCLGGHVVDKLVAFALWHTAGVGFAGRAVRTGLRPGLAAVVRSLNDLAKPARSLRGENPVRVHGRGIDVVDLPACE